MRNFDSWYISFLENSYFKFYMQRISSCEPLTAPAQGQSRLQLTGLCLVARLYSLCESKAKQFSIEGRRYLTKRNQIS